MTDEASPFALPSTRMVRGEQCTRGTFTGAYALSLQGEASPAGFQAMLEGRDPHNGETTPSLAAGPTSTT
jgi:hypothetical protein